MKRRDPGKKVRRWVVESRQITIAHYTLSPLIITQQLVPGVPGEPVLNFVCEAYYAGS